ncbi:hypothetical protein K3163_09410 [Qipengyuania sp. 1NDW9]|uniref:hypothetical protein n=1 Tax=Qipengyuania TaxID=1855416 RepID=UPI001C87BB6A|nr:MULTISPECIES: hypothetical protein [Qipengyuania]MBX7493426.1 hypothetical protein [Qipengyuania xiapuensis]UOR14546.1 hypothetical protein LCM05_08560 [Qipengyuania aquimaris]
MTEERITETTDSAGNTHTTHTVVTDGGGTKSNSTPWGLIIILIVLAIGAFVIFSQMSDAEVAKDNAVADAANEVGEAAGQVGDAAESAGEAVQDAVEN